MFKWIGNALKSVASWVGEGLSSIISWVLSGVISVLTKVIDAGSGIFDLLDAIWGFVLTVKDLLFGLLPALFPWIPEDVLGVISAGFFAVLVAGIIKLIRK